MFTSVRGFWGAVGVMLALIALFLVLNNGKSAAALITAATNGGQGLAKVLQGR